MARASRLNLNNILFSLFWWFIQKISPKHGEKLLFWGLKAGAFPNRSQNDPILETEVCGFHFKTPLGIGPGFDKQGNVVDDLIFMGAGFGEFGPYTLEHENPTTETFFLRKDKAIVTQSLGYKNIGISNVLPQLINRRYLPNIISVNITSTADSEEENVKLGRMMTYAEEFSLMVRKVAPYTDIITINLAHPETELSTLLSDASSLVPLLKGIKKAAYEAAPIQRPRIWVKIPLTITPLEVPMVCQNLMDAGIDGIIVGGALSLSQAKVPLTPQHTAGMLSGLPTKKYVLEMISKVHQFTKGQIPIIACGGIFSGMDAYACLAAGASLLQIGSVLRFDGPKAVTKINRELATILRQKGLKSVNEAIGIDFY